MDCLIKKNRKRFGKVYTKVCAGLVLDRSVVKLLKSGCFMFRYLKIVKYNNLLYIEGFPGSSKTKLLLNKYELLQFTCLNLKTKIIQVHSFYIIRNIIKVFLVVVDKLYSKR